MQCCGKAHTGENHPNWGGGKVTRFCEMCGKEFLVKPHIVKEGGGKFCSHRCYSRAKRQPITIMCRGCGYMFDIMPFELGKRKFCSLECYKKSRKTGRSPLAAP